jgi:hypothetical protein
MLLLFIQNENATPQDISECRRRPYVAGMWPRGGNLLPFGVRMTEE